MATTSQKRAHEIMGKNMFNVEEAIRYFRVNPIRRELTILSEIPFLERVLRQCKDTHVLVAVFPLSILEIRCKVQDAGLFCDQYWYNEEAFAKERGSVAWQLYRKTPLDNSTSKTWRKQQSLLHADEEVPTAQMSVYTIIGHYLANGGRLFEYAYVRTSSENSNGVQVYVGCFNLGGLHICDDENDRCFDSLGVSCVLKQTELLAYPRRLESLR